MPFRDTSVVHPLQPCVGEPIPMRKPPTGEPCAGEPHARFDGRELETERTGHGCGEERPCGKPLGTNGFMPYRQNTPPRQLSTLLDRDLVVEGP